MLTLSISVMDVVVVTLAALVSISFVKSRRSSPLPPGPSGWPLIGNILDMPTREGWKTFARWGEKYGAMTYVNLLGQPMVILNSRQLATEMLEKKSTIYSDRPELTLLGKMVGWDHITSLLPHGAEHRETRRMFAPALGSRSAIANLRPLMEDQISRFLPRMLEHPSGVVEQILKTVAGTILLITYGYQPREENDPLVQAVKGPMHEFSMASTFGAFWVDVFPLLKYVPAWMPGATWKRAVSSWSEEFRTLRDEPFNYVKEQMAAGTAGPSFTIANLADGVSAEKEVLIKQAAASLYAGGEDSSHSAISSFFLAIMSNPEALRKAREEIDTVIGNDRIPVLEDRDSLPYVNALVSEVYRWNPPVPLGMPHRLVQDDIHAGYHLPKGTVVVANIWNFLHDPEVYEDPFAFNPDRYFQRGSKGPEPDPREVLWGFGRRVCPGQHLADACIFLAIMKSVAVFDIARPVINGVEVESPFEFTTGTVSHPQPFHCVVKARSEKAEALIREIHLEPQ